MMGVVGERRIHRRCKAIEVLLGGSLTTAAITGLALRATSGCGG